MIIFLPKILNTQFNFLSSLWGANLDLLGKALEPLSTPGASLTEQGMDGCSVPGPHRSSYVIPSGIAREAAWSLIAVLFLPVSSIFHCIDAFMGTNTQIIGGKNNSLQMEDITHRYFLNKSFFPVCQALTLFPRVACPGWLPARKWTARWKLFCTRQPEEAQRWRCTPHKVLELQPKM